MEIHSALEENSDSFDLLNHKLYGKCSILTSPRDHEKCHMFLNNILHLCTCACMYI